MYSLDSVHKRIIFQLKYFILALPILILWPFPQQHICSVFWFHVTHLLFQFMRHLPCAETWVNVVKTKFFAFFDGLLVYNTFDWDIFEEAFIPFFFGRCFQIGLLSIDLFRLFTRLFLLLLWFTFLSLMWTALSHSLLFTFFIVHFWGLFRVLKCWSWCI